MLLVGSYFISIELLARIASHCGVDIGTILKGFIIFLALLGLAVLAFSDRLRKTLKRFITFYLGRPSYNYQKEWIEFTRQTSSILDIRGLSQIIANRISKMMDVLPVTVWLVDSPSKKAEIGGSTSISEKPNPNPPKLSTIVLEMIQAVQEKIFAANTASLTGIGLTTKRRKKYWWKRGSRIVFR